MHQHLRQTIWDVSDRQKGLSAYIQHENHEVVCSPYIYFVDIFNQKKKLETPQISLLKFICNDSTTNL